jgi:hypothetical protein
MTPFEHYCIVVSGIAATIYLLALLLQAVKFARMYWKLRKATKFFFGTLRYETE